MNLDIQFGDLEEAQPEPHWRPDRDKRFVVVPFDEPAESDLPIFVDMDVIRDMETHARSDTQVELGGVLLGGQYEDEQGEPFVVITDSLRAQHYQASKGSFKFTHETWEQITRQREEFPDDVQMVGWYHTHPDWGVFLSGMDMFICDHFFNKPLDVALVIDPCRDDRGMFQWTDDPAERVRRTGGFYIMTSRFRQSELERFAAQLKGAQTMTTNPKFSDYSSPTVNAPAPVVNISDQRGSFQTFAVLGMMTTQLLVMALIAWKLLAPVPATPPSDANLSPQIAELQQRLDQFVEAERYQRRVESQLDVLDRVIQGANGEPGGLVRELQRQQQDLDDLKVDLQAYRAAEERHLSESRRLSGELALVQSEAQRSQRLSDQQILRLEDQLVESKKEVRQRLDEIATLNETIEALDPSADLSELSSSGSELTWFSPGGSGLGILIGAGFGLALLIGGVVVFVAARKNQNETKHDPDNNASDGSDGVEQGENKHGEET